MINEQLNEKMSTNTEKQEENINIYQREIQYALDVYYKELSDPSKKIPNSEGKIYSPYNTLVNKIGFFITEDLEYYEYLPEFLQFDEKVINAYTTAMNTTYQDYICNVKVAVKYCDEVSKCWEQYHNGEFTEDILTYTPSDYEGNLIEEYTDDSETKIQKENTRK